MLVGLGTGSTAAFAIAAIGKRMAQGLRITAVATSRRTASDAAAAGIALIDFATVGAIDLAIDGVDEIDADLRAIKGAGGAMLREKIVGSAAARMIAIADASKRVETLGRGAVPIEVLPFAHAFVEARILAIGGAAASRLDAAGRAATSDQGNLILDCSFGPLEDPQALARALDAIPGLLGHGLFLDEIDALYLADGAGVTVHERRAHPSRDSLVTVPPAKGRS